MIKINDIPHKNIRVSFSFISLLILFGVIAFAAVVQAQETTQEPDANVSVFDELRTQREALINNETPAQTTNAPSAPQGTQIETPVQELQATLQTQSQTRIKNLAANISNRLDAYVARLDNITARLESRMMLISAEGMDISASQTHLADVQVHLEEARNKLRTIDAEVATVVGGTEARAAWQNLKAVYQAIKTDIQAAHEDTRLALSALKASFETPVVTESEETITPEEVITE